MASFSGPALIAAAVAFVAPGPAQAEPQVRILGFTTQPRLAGVAPEAKPGGKIDPCYTSPSGQREVSVVYRARMSPRARIGIALWGPPRNPSGFESEPSNAQVMGTAVRWGRSGERFFSTAYGFTFAKGPFGPESIDGRWFAKVVVDGRTRARKSVRIAC